MYEDENLGVYSGYQPGYQPYRAPQEPERKPEPGKKKKGSFFRKALVSVSLGIFFGLSAGVSFYAVRTVENIVSPDQSAAAVKETGTAGENQAVLPNKNDSGVVSTVNGSVINTTTDVSNVVNQVMPSVVAITNTYVDEEQTFFGTIQGEGQASGSGIIVGESDSELLVATNNHVIDKAETLGVQFIDGETVEAQVKGTDSSMDLAVIAVQLEDIKQSTLDEIAIAQLGDSDELQVGEPAIAIGNALGYGQSVTTGVISAVNREVDMNGAKGTFLQTDAAINPGNSGGALLNMKGQVVGINSNKIGGTVVEGMGYAIPISSAKPIIEELMTKTTRVRVEDGRQGYLGISGVNVTEDASQAYGMPKGVMVAQVYDGTAASAAGLVKGNIITKFDGSAVTSMEELKQMLNYYSAGTTVELTVMEGSPDGWAEKRVPITLGEQQQMIQQ